MKKFFTLIAALIFSVSMFAQEVKSLSSLEEFAKLDLNYGQYVLVNLTLSEVNIIQASYCPDGEDSYGEGYFDDGKVGVYFFYEGEEIAEFAKGKQISTTVYAYAEKDDTVNPPTLYILKVTDDIVTKDVDVSVGKLLTSINEFKAPENMNRLITVINSGETEFEFDEEFFNLSDYYVFGQDLFDVFDTIEFPSTFKSVTGILTHYLFDYGENTYDFYTFGPRGEGDINHLYTTISEGGYSTFCPVFNDVQLPEGLTAYTAQISDSKSYVKLEKINSKNIKAGTGVVLAGEPGTYEYDFTNDAAVVSSGNDLVGATSATNDLDNVYALAVDNDICVFGKWTGEVFPAGKAYLAGEASSAKLSIVIGGEATSIEAIQSVEAEQSGATYNLAGQKVSGNFRGIVIKNGKKYIK